jgi:crotonobetainyl-CoA:carnitine CoA-transferase CaiB-like acyl-CoA transferase
MPQPQKGALDGVRVLDLTQFVLGPYATQILGDLGADVIKIEEPAGDRQRRMGSLRPGSGMSSTFVALNRNKRSVVLDLKTEAGGEALRRLIATADIFIHNMRAESMARLGFAYEAVAAIKPDIVYLEATGFAAEGPYAGRQAFDDLIQAGSGAFGLSAMVDPQAPLRPLPAYLADKTCGLFAVIAALAALRHRERTGEGQYVAVPMLESFTGFMMLEHLYGETFSPPTGRFGNSMVLSAHRKALATKDGWLMIQPASPAQAARFLELGGVADFYESPRFVAAKSGREKVSVYNAMLGEAAATRTTEDWLEVCAANTIPAMIVNRPADILEDPQLKETLFEERSLEGEGPYRAMKPGLRLARTPASIRRDPPALGRDTDEVLGALG